MQFDSLDDIKAFCRDLPEGDARSADAAALAQQALTKPPGALAVSKNWQYGWRAGSELGLEPLLDLNMRLGEASGAGVAILLLRAALACHAGMATFAEAGVSSADK